MQTSTIHVQRVQHAQGKPGAPGQAAQTTAHQAAPITPHTYSSEAIAAMCLVAVVAAVIAWLVFMRLIRSTRSALGRKPPEPARVSQRPYSGRAIVLTFTATAIQGTSGHDNYEMAAVINEDYEKHLAECAECRDYIVTDLHEYAEQLDHLVLDGRLRGITRQQ